MTTDTGGLPAVRNQLEFAGVKLVAFLKAAPGLTWDEFVDYYEDHHVPLIREVMPGITDYRRSYLPEPVGGYDVLTEIWFAERETFDRAMALATTGEGAERIARDEEKFLDRSATQFSIVDERGGPIAS